jgi:serine/threonine protein kinase
MNNHALPIGTSLRDNGYSIDQVLGQGGFGITYKAVDQLGRPVAIKEFYPTNFCYRQEQGVVKMPGYTGVFDFDKYREEFFNEARTLTKFDHPNIVKILDAFKANNTAYFVMPFEEGQTLQDILALKVHLSESETLKYMKEVAHALEYIHQQETLHRDIKPSNIIIRKTGKPILIDFGAARQLVDGNEEHTAILSHGFAPPEQYDKNGKKGHFVDVYGLCATCYYCLTGSVPIRADHRLTQQIPEPNVINPSVSDQLNEIIVKGLELDSSKRYQSVSKLLYDLTSVSETEDEDHELIDSQRNGLDVVNQFVGDDQTNVLILTGAVNTGKTTIVKKFLAKAIHSMLAVKLLTVGSRIAEQLMHRDGLEAYSVYKHIYNFTSAPNSKGGNESIDLEKPEVSESDIKRAHYSVKANLDGEEVVYIIEEAQLLSDSFIENDLFILGSGKLLHDLIQFIDFAKHRKRKLLIVGDDKRLSRGPSEESALSKDHLTKAYQLAVKVFELPDIILTDRQRNILEVSKMLRDSIIAKRFNRLVIASDQNSVLQIRRDQFPEKFRKLNSWNQSIFLTYSNRHALDANISIRKDLLGRHEILEKGDLVIFNNTVSVTASIVGLFPMQIYKGEIAEIRSVGDEEIKTVRLRGKPVVTLTFRRVKVFIPRYQKDEEVIILQNYLLEEKDLSKEQRQALLVLARDNYKEFTGKKQVNKEEFTSYLKSDPYYNSGLIKYGYSMTCHKANGVNWNYVFVNCETERAKDNEDYFKWLYTALASAKEKIFLIDFSEIHPFIKIEWRERPEAFDRFGKAQSNVFSSPFDIKLPDEALEQIQNLKFPPQFPSLPILWYLISSKLSSFHISVTKVEHLNYQQLYSFADENGQTVKIRFYYNAEGKITRNTPYPKNAFSDQILRILESDSSAVDENFSESFLKELYHSLRNIFLGQGITIKSIEHEAYHEKYLITRNEEFLQLTIYYNAEGFVTTFWPIRFNSQNLYQTVKELVESKLKRRHA